MIDCAAEIPQYEAPGPHECLLRSDALENWHCPPDGSACWAFRLIIKSGCQTCVCDVTGISITINGALLPVEISKTPGEWSMVLRYPPLRDAIVHWTIVLCKEPSV